MPNLRGKTWTTTTPANVGDAQYWEDHLISDAVAAKAASSVQSVNNTTPDAQGNVDIVALPDGGTVGQVLTKQSSVDGDADWEDPASSGHTIEDEDGNTMPYQETLQFENAEVTNDSVNNKTIVDCKGSKGDAATITVGTVTTLPAGSQATVVNSGTSGAAVFNFGIPKGADGSGSGDMTKAEYATNGEAGVVDEAITLKGLTASITDLNKTSNLATVATTGAYSDLSGKPTLATVATSGSYNDLSNKPTIPTVDQTYSATSSNAQSGKAVASAISGKADSSSLATVATSGSYNDLSNKPTIPTVNNGTLTIQQNGTNKATFTANQSSGATANILTGAFIKTASVANNAVTFTGINDSGTYGYDVFFDITGSSTNKSPYAKLTSISGAGTSNMSLTYETDADSGTNNARLYQYK